MTSNLLKPATRSEMEARAEAEVRAAMDMRERAAMIAESFDAAMNGRAMRQFASPSVASAVIHRDLRIAAAIRALPLVRET